MSIKIYIFDKNNPFGSIDGKEIESITSSDDLFIIDFNSSNKYFSKASSKSLKINRQDFDKEIRKMYFEDCNRNSIYTYNYIKSLLKSKFCYGKKFMKYNKFVSSENNNLEALGLYILRSLIYIDMLAEAMASYLSYNEIVFNDTMVHKTIYSYDKGFISRFKYDLNRRLLANRLANENKKYIIINSKSDNKLAAALACSNRTLNINDTAKPLELVYLSAKVFENNVQFLEVLDFELSKARNILNYTCLKHTGFYYEGIKIKLEQEEVFFSYLYIKSLLESKLNLDELIDIDLAVVLDSNVTFKGSEAKALLIYRYLKEFNLLEAAMRNFKEFYILVHKL